MKQGFILPLLIGCCAAIACDGEPAAPQGWASPEQWASADPPRSSANELEEPTIHYADFNVGVAAASPCVGVSFEGEDENPLIYGCDGWSISGCDDLIVAAYEGNVAGEAVLLRRSGGRWARSELSDAVMDGVKRHFGPEMEYVHLRYLQARCGERGMAVPFEGSFIADGSQGSATGMTGTIDVQDDGAISVRVQPIPTRQRRLD